MLYDLTLPTIIPTMSTALIEVVYAKRDGALKPGDKLLDLTIDLGASFSQNCPPISHYRLVAREKAVVRRLSVAPGDMCKPGDLIAALASDVQEPCDLPAARPFRITVAGILRHATMWSTSQPA